MCLLALISLIATASAANQDGFLLVPISKNTSSLTKRSGDGYVYGSVDNQVYQYHATPQFGKTLQAEELLVDTGSWITFVYGSGSGARYEYDNSSATDLYAEFDSAYGDGSWVSGNFVRDQVKWGGSSVELDFGYIPEYNASHMQEYGVLGLSFPAPTYSSYPVALREQGVIATAAFSLYLGSRTESDSSLLFGAIDKSKFTGELKTVNLSAPDSFVIPFSIAGVSGDALIDSGASFTVLTQNVIEAAAESLNATWNAETNNWEYRGPGEPTKDLTVSFDGFDLSVPFTEIWTLDRSGSGFNLIFDPRDRNVFGDNFLRAWYVVYDLDNKQISLGQASYNAGGNGAFVTIKPSGVQASLN